MFAVVLVGALEVVGLVVVVVRRVVPAVGGIVVMVVGLRVVLETTDVLVLVLVTGTQSAAKLEKEEGVRY